MSKRNVSRREFLKWSAAIGSGAILVACSPTATAAPTTAPAPTQAPAATNPPAPTQAPQSSSAEAIKLTMWTYSGDEVMLAKMYEGYKEKNPTTDLEISKFDLGDMVQKITTSLVAGSGLPDLADVEQGYFRKFVYGEGLLDLEPFGVTAHKDEIPKWAWEAGLSPNKSKVLFIYYSLGIAVIHYRRSIFKNAGLPDTPEEVQKLISTTWQDNMNAGEKISKEKGPWMYDNASDICWMYRDQYNPVWYDESAKKFQFDTPVMLDGLKLALDARKRGLDSKVAPWTPEWNNTFKMGTVATYAYGDWLAMNIMQYGGESTKGDWGMVPVPGTTGATAGGSLLCGFAQTKHPEEVGKVLSFMSFDKAAQIKQLDYYCFPSLIASWDDPKMSEPEEFYGGQKTRLIKVAGAKNSAARVYTAYDSQCGNIFGTEVTNCLDQGKDPKQALADAQKTAEAQIEIVS